MLAVAQQTIARHGLLSQGDRVVAAVSGGPDSVALLAALRALQSAYRLHLTVAHLNHGLRPEAGDDARFVQRLATGWRLPAVVEEADVSAHAAARGLSVEAAARDLRYDFLRAVAERVGAGKVAVGHTADDQAETLLVRLLRGARPGGMRPARALGTVTLIRPLLDVWRADVLAYLRGEGVAWRDDPTNRDLRLLRNRVRHDLMPLLQGYIPEVRSRLKRAADVLAAEDEIVEKTVDAVALRVLIPLTRGVRVAGAGLRAQPLAVRRRLVRRAIDVAGGNIRRLKFVHIEGVVRLAERAVEGQRLDLPGVRVHVEDGDLVIMPATAQEAGSAGAGRTRAGGLLEGKRG